MDLRSLLTIEDERIAHGACFLSDRPDKTTLSFDAGSAERLHGELIIDLIYSYLVTKFGDKAITMLHKGFIVEGSYTPCFISGLEANEIPRLCEHLHIAFLNSGFTEKNGAISRKRSKEFLLEKGAVYTDTQITEDIITNTLSIIEDKGLKKAKILDFACGTGRFYEKLLSVLHDKYGIEEDYSICHIVNAMDLDETALNVTRLKAVAASKNVNDDLLNAIATNILLRNGLIKDIDVAGASMVLRDNDFEGAHQGCFDAIVSNPPYLVLKPNKNKVSEAVASSIIKQVAYYRTSGDYKYSIEGMLNLYQLSIEAMLRMMRPGAALGVICPSTLFADISCAKLRKHMLTMHDVRGIKYFSEDAQLFENVTQATCIFYLEKDGETSNIKVVEGQSSFTVPFELVKKLFPDNYEVPSITEIEWGILWKMSKYQKLKCLPTIRNKRGELDLTLCKKYIVSTPTEYRLVRGNMVTSDGIEDVNHEYVDPAFVFSKSKDYIENDSGKARLICKQISNMQQKVRLTFVLCEKSDIIGNSCNYISADESTLVKLESLLNSSILNWRFKVTSSNNHINNYELDELPIPEINSLGSISSYGSKRNLDYTVGKLYGLSDDEIEFIITGEINRKEEKMKIYNHVSIKLGAHEAEMAKHIPPGGNWKNIPDTISDARLDGIREGGGRTTYYGRLVWDKPSYTIATYFNRVPNGCNLHPDIDRTLSIREAARLQSFPDDFVFKGSQASQFKQIGNAVPPVLARFVSSLIKPYLNSYNFIDLFAGCGGMSEGFIMNGFNLIAANEFDKNIMMTNKFNHSKYTTEENFVLGDVTKDETKNQIIKACEGHQIDVIVGGPPCQGFSYAGWRDPNDTRNQLFKEFVKLVDVIRPKFFVMENVLGILTMRNGDAIKEIIQEFASIGYYVNTPIKLNAEQYGVPQKRKRVFIIGSLDGVIVEQPEPLFSEIGEKKDADLFHPATNDYHAIVTVRDAIGSFPHIEDGEGEVETEASFKNPSPFDLLMQKKISWEEFYDKQRRRK